LDSELGDENLVISDIIQSLLSPNAHAVIFISPTEEDRRRVDDLVEVIRDNLIEEMKADEKGFPYKESWHMSKQECKTPESTRKALKEKLEPWY